MVEEKKKRCFVVMGFGKKTDFQSNPQRVLDLDRTYDDIIEPAVTAAGLECIRADKIIHSTVIDKPMYENLLEADLVIADLSTANVNAVYELGVRHALRPHGTIVMAEDKFVFPFDINHLSIAKYQHLETEIGFREVMRMRDVLQKKIAAMLDREETDSPVFLFLPHLIAGENEVPPVAPTAEPKDDQSLADLLGMFESTKKGAKQPGDWMFVMAVLDRILKLQPADPYLIQQRALATYKAAYPNALESLHAARDVLQALNPDTTSDAETAGLWGAIHKRLWNTTGDSAHLDKAIRSYCRGYFIKDDYYNGINYAFLLNVRAAKSEGDDAIADRVLARRVRAEVLTLCDKALGVETINPDVRFWITATKAEALYGMGRQAESEELRKTLGPDDWKTQSLDDQLAALRALQP
jgi:MAP3K TRAFs-binding domain